MAAFNAAFASTGNLTAKTFGRMGDVHLVGPATASLDDTAPTVSNPTPTPGTTLGEFDTFGFDVTDAGGLLRVFVVAVFPTLNVKEVVHDGTEWSANYSGTRTEITDGYQFAGILRAGGWPATPTFVIYPVDTAGNEG